MTPPATCPSIDRLQLALAQVIAKDDLCGHGSAPVVCRIALNPSASDEFLRMGGNVVLGPRPTP